MRNIVKLCETWRGLACAVRPKQRCIRNAAALCFPGQDSEQWDVQRQTHCYQCGESSVINNHPSVIPIFIGGMFVCLPFSVMSARCSIVLSTSFKSGWVACLRLRQETMSATRRSMTLQHPRMTICRKCLTVVPRIGNRWDFFGVQEIQ